MSNASGAVRFAGVTLASGRPADVTVRAGVIAEVTPPGRASGPVDLAVDAGGGALLPGLHDHHIHLLATAAARRSVPCGPGDVGDAAGLAAALRAADRALPDGVWIRATAYHDSVAGPLDRAVLDAIVPNRPVRVQYRTGSLWVLNSVALAMIVSGAPYPSGVEFDQDGEPTGRLWRVDDWLRTRLPATEIDLAPVASAMARAGVTALTDATVTNTAAEVGHFAVAMRRGELPQRLTVMSAVPIVADTTDSPVGTGTAGRLTVGPVKVLPDDADLPGLEDLVAVIHGARVQARAVAVHVVTRAELLLTLAAFTEAGSRPGDRLEHGGVIPPESIADIAALGLTVVTQPHFIAERGDQYLADVESDDIASLYRCASLQRAGVPVWGGSDAPYGGTDPWAAMRAAVLRTTPAGHVLSPDERIGVPAAIALFTAGAPRVAVGTPAELCLLRVPVDALTVDDLTTEVVAATMIDGDLRGPALGTSW